MNIYRLIRDTDISGVSGTGHIADAVEFESGKVVVSSRVSPYSLSIHNNLEAAIQVHGHNGATRFEADKTLLEFARKALPMVEDYFTPTYGVFQGGDPRNFTPDPECSTEAERQRHQEACTKWQWEAGELKSPPPWESDCLHVSHPTKAPLILTRSQFGLGINYDSKGRELCEKVKKILEGC